MRPQLSQGNHMQALSGVSLKNHGIKDPKFVLVSLDVGKIGSIIDYAYRNEIAQLTEYNHNEFRYLHESILRADGGLPDYNKIWLVMTAETCILFKLKYNDSIVGIVTLPSTS